MVLCMQENPFKCISFVCLYTHSYLEGNTVDSNCFYTTVCSSKYPGLQRKQIRSGYSSSRSPAVSHHTIKQTGTPCLAGEGRAWGSDSCHIVITVPGRLRGSVACCCTGLLLSAGHSVISTYLQ